jgi:hypothetical protein
MAHKKILAPGRLTVSIALVGRRIHLVRHHNVMLDRDLAELYGVKTIALRQQVKRNLGAISGGLYVPGVGRGGRDLGITNCDTIAPQLRRVAAIRVYPGRRGDAVFSVEEHTGRSS